MTTSISVADLIRADIEEYKVSSEANEGGIRLLLSDASRETSIYFFSLARRGHRMSFSVSNIRGS